MRYSVIIPYKDIVDLVVRAVQSVPDRSDIEVIIINNGTTELPTSLFAGRHNVQVLWDAIGKGAGAARNVGLEHAKGEWLLMLDADDFFTENAFEIMDKQADNEADIVFFKMSSCDSDTMEPANRDTQFNELMDRYLEHQDEGALRYEWTAPTGKMIRRSIVEEYNIRFDETQAANDVTFSLLTGYYAKNIKGYKDTLYCITVRNESLTSTPSLRHLNDRIEVSIRFNRFVRAHGLARYQKSIMYHVRMIARNYGLGEAMKTIWRSIQAGNNPLIGISRWAKTAQKIKQHD